MITDDLKQGLIALCNQIPEWIPVESRLPEMFENVIIHGTLSAELCPKILEARRWTGYSGPNAGRDELGGEWEWLTPGDYHVNNVNVWCPKPISIRLNNKVSKQ